MSVRAQLRALTFYFALTFALSWALWLAAAALSSRANFGTGRTLLFLPGTFTPAFVALWLSGRLYPPGQRSELIERVFKWQFPARWYMFAAGYMAVVKLVAAVLHRITAGSWPAFGSVPLYLILLATIISTPVQAGEEIGWRGYALPRMVERMGVPAASILLGLIWGLWHLPLFLLANTDSTGQPFLVFLLAVTAVSVAMTWLYQNTAGSLLAVMLMHAAINNTTGIVPSAESSPPGAFSFHASWTAWLTVVVLWIGATYFLFRMQSRQRAHTYAEGLSAWSRVAT